MPFFFLPLIACFLASTGGRDQRLAAALSAKLGATGSLLAVFWVISAITAGLAALAGAAMAALLPPAGKTMLIAFALLLAAGELAWPIRLREPEEPTRSLFAIALVLGARQLGDAARFLIVAFTAASGVHAFAAIGGALGGGAALTMGWALKEGLHDHIPLRAIRWGMAALMLIAAIWTGLLARGIF